MVDPLTAVGAAASIIQLIQASQEILKYGSEFAEAPSNIRNLQTSLENLESLLKRLQDRCEDAPIDAPWLQGLWQVKEVENGGNVPVEHKGVLAELWQTIDRLSRKLNPSKNWKKTEVWQRSTYYFKKDLITEIQSDVTRYLGEINIALALKNDETSSEILNSIKADRDANKVLALKYDKTSSEILNFLKADRDANKVLALKNNETSSEILDFIKADRDATNAQWTIMTDRSLSLELTQRKDNVRRLREQDEIERAEIIAWLSPFSFLAKQEELWAECFKETGGWLLQD